MGKIFMRTKVETGPNEIAFPSRAAARTELLQKLALAIPIMILVGLAFYHLSAYPLTWFDEGSHLHVPKTLVTQGIYADSSSEGLRYYGPTLGVGPTVMLPIAAAFKLFGIGLLQARIVIALYLLASVILFFRLANGLVSRRFAWVATALLVATPAVALVDFGRQVLGEVPGLFFLLAGMLVWFQAWEKPSWQRLVAAGGLFGLSVITKNQYLIFVLPAIGLTWAANQFYYRQAKLSVFLIPGAVLMLCYLAWEAVLLFGLGPATAMENLTYLRQATQGAALVFSPAIMKSVLNDIVSDRAFFGLLIPALLYGGNMALRRSQKGMRWGFLLGLVVVNLGWYLLASIGWSRYAFVGMAFSSLFVTQLISELTGGLLFVLRAPNESRARASFRWAMIAWLAVMVVVPLAQTASDVISPPFNAPAQMAAYLDQNVSKTALIETWEPEMGFLTDHRFHFAPQALLNEAVGFIWLGKKAPAEDYPVADWGGADYVLVGAFSRWVNLYPPAVLQTSFHLVTEIGGYDLYAHNQ
jgi:hypothetical protein